MKNEIENLLNGRGLETQQDNKNLTQNLRQWRKDRNITKADYLVFVGNILEELLEPVYNKGDIEWRKEEILNKHFRLTLQGTNDDIIDAIQDIQVFCINETELMGYDNLKCNNEVFQEINSRQQDPMQYMEWDEFGHNGQKWKKWSEQPKETLYKANYEACKL